MTSQPARFAEAIMPDVSPRARKITLTLLTITYFFSYMDRQILSILLEDIKADLILTDTQLGIISGLAFAVFYATLGIPVAWLADRKNRRNIIAVALALWSGATALCGFANNFLHLLLARIGVGIGEAGAPEQGDPDGDRALRRDRRAAAAAQRPRCRRPGAGRLRARGDCERQ